MLKPTDLKNLSVRDRMKMHNNLLRCSRRKFMQPWRKKYYRQAIVANLKALSQMDFPKELDSFVQGQLLTTQRLLG